jgi:hypothetical protein
MDGSIPKRINEMVAPGRGPEGARKQRKSRRIKQLVGAALLVLLIAALVVVGLLLYKSQSTPGIDGSKYQAVFMTNGQVYFGKLTTLSNQYMQLSDIFYLQTSSTNSENLQDTADDAETDVQLIKLGNEVHGPEDQMVIAKDQILFFENLKVDGKVAKSIAEYQKKQ